MIYYSFKLQKRISNPLVLRENCSKGKGLIPVNTLLAHHHYFLSFFPLSVFFSFFFHRACALQTKSSKSTTILEKNFCYMKTNDRTIASSRILLTTVFCDYSASISLHRQSFQGNNHPDHVEIFKASSFSIWPIFPRGEFLWEIKIFRVAKGQKGKMRRGEGKGGRK